MGGSYTHRVKCNPTASRRTFVQDTLAENPFVHIEAVGFGFEARSVERSLQEVLECQDDRFARDILRYGTVEPNGGLAFDLANAQDNETRRCRQRLDSGLWMLTQSLEGTSATITHNPDVLVNGDAKWCMSLRFAKGSARW